MILAHTIIRGGCDRRGRRCDGNDLSGRSDLRRRVERHRETDSEKRSRLVAT